MSDKERLRIIQTDKFSCSRMTIDHVNHLSKVGLIPKLETRKLQTQDVEEIKEQVARSRAQKRTGVVQEIKVKNELPKKSHLEVKLVKPSDVLQLAPQLYRMTQSWTTLQSFGDSIMPVSGKGQTLLEYPMQYSQVVEGKDREKKLQNLTSHYKAGRIKDHIEKYSQSHSGDAQLTEIIVNRKQDWHHFLSATSPERDALSKQQVTQYSLNDVIQTALKKLLKNTIACYEHELGHQRQSSAIRESSHALMMALESVHTLSDNIKALDKLRLAINLMLRDVSKEEQANFIPRILELKIPVEAKKELIKIFSHYGYKHVSELKEPSPRAEPSRDKEEHKTESKVVVSRSDSEASPKNFRPPP